MNNITSHKLFKVILDKNALGIAFGGAPAFLEEEIDIFLNQALFEILSNKVTGNNVLKTNLEGSISNISELDKLIKTDKVFAIKENPNAKDYSNEFCIPNVHDNGNRMTICDVQLHCGGYLFNCQLVKHDTAKSFKWTYNNIPWVKNPVFTIEDDTIYIYADPIYINDAKYKPTQITDDNGNTVTGYHVDLTYIKKPTPFDYTKPEEELDFPDDVMYEIINRAVLIALDNIESQRVTTKASLNQLSE